MIRLFNAGVFSGQCDLLIVSCADDKNAGKGFRPDLEKCGLPLKLKRERIISVGDVIFYPASSGPAPVVGYAVTVDTRNSSGISCNSDILHSVYRKIKKKCDEEGWRTVNVPLLGSGYGGMSPNEAYRYINEEFGGDDCSLLINLYILKKYEYNQVKNYRENRNFETHNNVVTNNITIYGGAANANILQGVENSVHTVTQEFDYDAVIDIIQKIKEKENDPSFDNAYGENAPIVRDNIEKAENLAVKKADSDKIKIIFDTVKNISAQISKNVVAESIVELLKQIIF